MSKTTIFIEANIGGGKSTFAQKLTQENSNNLNYNNTLVPGKKSIILLEPVKEWLEMKDSNNKNILEQSFQSPLKEAREHFEKEYLITQLKKNHGNISKTADFIGMERSALHRKLKSLGIKGIN